ncbi:MAG: FG-GAP repeat domain-containing protein [Planctomycetota bacterium]
MSRTTGFGLVVTLFASLAAPALVAQQLFLGRTEPVGDNPVSIASADLNLDGYPDLITANSNASSLSLLLADRGGFAAHTDLAVGTSLRQVLVVDLDNDGWPDLVTRHGNDTVEVRLQVAPSSYALAGSFATGGAGTMRMATGDFNEDGALDLVVANQWTDTVTLLLGDGNGQLGPAASFAVDNIAPELVARPRNLVVADIDEDGHLDVVTANFWHPSTLSLLRGNGAGAFATSENIQMGAFGQFGGDSIAVGDLNGDGHLDLAVGGSGSVDAVRLGDGTGAFAAPLPGLGPFPVAIADFDSDGHVDVLHTFSGLVRVDFGDGAGGSTHFSAVPLGSLGGVAHFDLEGDGDLDLAVANTVGDEVAVLPNDSAGGFPLPPLSELPYPGNVEELALGDLSGDGYTDAVTTHSSIGELRISLGAAGGSFGPSSIALDVVLVGQPAQYHLRDPLVADFDGDGRNDVVLLMRAATVSTVDHALVLHGDGTGALPTSTVTQLTNTPVAMDNGDFNGDSIQDLALLNFAPPGVAVRLGDGAGSFLAPTTTPFVGFSGSQHLTAADVSGDGFVDVVATASSTSFLILHGDGLGGLGGHVGVTGLGVRVLPADLNEDGAADMVGVGAGGVLGVMLASGGGFLPPVLLPAAGLPLVSDLNRDGHLDLVAVSLERRTFTCLLGDGSGAFGDPTTYLAYGEPWAAGLAELDGSGFPDLVLANRGAGTYFPPHLTSQLNLSASPWLGLGSALGGEQGAPVLSGYGTLEPVSPITLEIESARPLGSAVLVIGAPAINAPFKGGVMVPMPSILIFGLPLDGSGAFSGSGTWYSGLPSGTSVYFQAWIADPFGPFSFAASNGLVGTTP